MDDYVKISTTKYTCVLGKYLMMYVYMLWKYRKWIFQDFQLVMGKVYWKSFLHVKHPIRVKAVVQDSSECSLDYP